MESEEAPADALHADLARVSSEISDRLLSAVEKGESGPTKLVATTSTASLRASAHTWSEDGELSMLWQRADELYTFQQYLEAIMPPPRMRAPDVFPVSTAEWAGGWAEVYPLLKLCWNAERYLHFMAEDPDNYERCKAIVNPREKLIRKAIRVALEPKSPDRRLVQMRIGPLPRELDEHLPGLSGKFKSVLDLEALQQLHGDITQWFMKPWGLMQRYLDSDLVQNRKEREEEVFSSPLELEYISSFIHNYHPDANSALYFILAVRRLERKQKSAETRSQCSAILENIVRDHLVAGAPQAVTQYGVRVPSLLMQPTQKVDLSDFTKVIASATALGQVSDKCGSQEVIVLGDCGQDIPVPTSGEVGLRVIINSKGTIQWKCGGALHETVLKPGTNYVVVHRDDHMLWSDQVSFQCFVTPRTDEEDKLDLLTHLKQAINAKVFRPLLPEYLQSEEYEALLERKALHSGEAYLLEREQEAADPSEIMQQGLLQKQGEGFAAFLRWRWRWFVLTRSGSFAYYEDEAAYKRGDKPLGRIVTQDVTNVVCPDEISCQVITPKRTFYLRADSKPHRQVWIQNMVACGLPRDVCIDDMDIVNLIGAGANGKVAEVTDKGTSQRLAMKVLNLDKVLEARGQLTPERVAVERQLLLELDHPYLVKGHSAFQQGNKLYMCMEFASGGDLWHHMYENKDCPLFKKGTARGVLLAGFYISQVVCALGALHAKDILYADLKPENLVIDDEGHIKITDFGLCRTNVESYSGQDGKPCYVSTGKGQLGGTEEYFAPELILTKERGPLGKALDWWTLGILAYEMFHKVTPFRKPQSRHIDERKLVRGEWVHPWVEFPGLPASARHFTEALLQPDAVGRLGSQGTTEVKKHPFFNDVCDFTQTWARFELKLVPPPWRPEEADHFDKAREGLKSGGIDFDTSDTKPLAQGKRLTELAPELQDWSFQRRGTLEGGQAIEDTSQDPVVQSWQKASGRKSGGAGYQFGDITRSVLKNITS